jgi:Hemerythrin HHE cation binding domain
MKKTKYNSDIFGALVADHDKHRVLLGRLEATEGASAERKALFEELTKEIKGHAAAEEQALWSTVMRKPDITEDARHAVAEHHEMDEMLNDLAATDMTTGGWLIRFRQVKKEYLHHIKEEEDELFPDVEPHLSEADQKFMADIFKRRKQAEKAKAEVTPEKKKD